MTNDLLTRVRSVARQAHRLVIGQALARWMCVVATTAFAAAFVDYLFRFREAPLRWLSFAAVCAAAAWSARRWLWPALASRTSDVQTARQIEHRFPDLHEQLSSAVAFLSQPANDPRYGSGELRAAVVGQATAAIAHHDLRTVVDRHIMKRAAALVGGTVVLLVLLAASDWSATRIALARLAMPWRDEAWPRRHHLEIVKPVRRLAVGQGFELAVVDRDGRLPSEVMLLLQFDGDGDAAIRQQPLTFAGGRMTHRFVSVTRSFRYRAVGGDDHEMPWTELTVVAAPRITKSQVTIRPPAYSKLPVETSERRIRAWEQSTAEFQLQFDRPLTSAKLLFRPRTGATTTVVGQAAVNGSFKMAPWTLTESGEYAWELTDRDGLMVLENEHSEVEVRIDAPPTIVLESPASDAEFTIHAVVPLRALATDDLAVQKISWQLGDANLVEHEAGAVPSFRELIDWDLAEMPHLQPGATLTVEAIATDFKPQSSERVTSTVSIISDDEFQSRLDDRRGGLLQLLQSTLQTQRIARRQAQVLAELSDRQTETVAALRPGLEASQRRVEELVVGDEGAASVTARMLEDLAVNRFESPQLTAHLTALRSELARIGTELLPPISRDLARAEWANGVRGQEVVIAAVEALVDRHGQWDRYNHLADEARQLLQDQSTLAEEARALPTAGRQLVQLSPGERAELDRLAQRLKELAQQVDRLHQRLDEMRRQLATDNPVGAKMLAEAINALEQSGVSEPLRGAARGVAENKLGAAEREFAKAQAGLESLVAALEQRSQAEEGARAEQLAAKAIAAFLVRQQVLLEGTAKQSPSARSGDSRTTSRDIAELSRDQSSLAADVSQFSLRVAPASLLATALQLVAQPMQIAAERLQQKLIDEPTLAAQQLAYDRLRQLHEALQQRSGPSPRETSEPPAPDDSPAQQKPEAPNVADLKLIRLIQSEINRRTSELEEKRNGGELSEEEQHELDEIHNAQKALIEKLDRSEKTTRHVHGMFPTFFVQAGQPPSSKPTDLLDDLLPRTNQSAPAGEDVGRTPSPVMQFGEQMRQIEKRLSERDTTPATQQLQSRLIDDLSRLIDSLEQQNPSPQPKAGSSQPQPKPNETPGARPGSEAGSGSGGTTTDAAAVANWARGVWGVLPDRVQRQMQSLSEEQFLPEYADVIRGYYQRLSERGNKSK